MKSPSAVLGHQFEFVCAGGSHIISRTVQETMTVLQALPGMPHGVPQNPKFLMNPPPATTTRMMKSKERVIPVLCALYVRRGDMYSTEPFMVDRLVLQNSVSIVSPQSVQHIHSVINQRNANIRDYVGRALLHDACLCGNTHVLAFLLGLPYIDVNVRDVQDATALHIAVRTRQTECVTILLGHKAVDLTARDRNGSTPLHLAMDNLDDVLVGVLCNSLKRRGVTQKDLSEQRDIFGRTPLDMFETLSPTFHECCYMGNVPALRALKTHFCFSQDNVVLPAMNGRTVVHEAAEVGNVDVLHYLLREAKVNLFSPGWCLDNGGATPMQYACRYGHLPFVRVLLEQGMDPGTQDTNRRTSLHCALYGRHWGVAQFLLESTPDDKNLMIDSIDASGMSCLHIAVGCGQYGLAELMLSTHRANPNVRANLRRPSKSKSKAQRNPVVLGESILAIALTTSQVSLPMLLLGHGAGAHNHSSHDISLLLARALDNQLYTICNEFVQLPTYRIDADAAILKHVLMRGSPDYGAVRWLLDYGARLDVLDEHGMSVLAHCVKGGYTKSVELVLQSGGSVSVNRENLISAAIQSTPTIVDPAVVLDIVLLLLRANESPSATRGEGMTPIHAACAHGRMDVAKILRSAGATFDETALYLALHEGPMMLLNSAKNSAKGTQTSRQHRAERHEALAVECCRAGVMLNDHSPAELLYLAASKNYIAATFALCELVRSQAASNDQAHLNWHFNLSDKMEPLSLIAKMGPKNDAHEMLRMLLLDAHTIGVEAATQKTKFTCCDVAFRNGDWRSVLVCLRRGIFPLLSLAPCSSPIAVAFRETYRYEDLQVSARRATLAQAPLLSFLQDNVRAKTSLFHALASNDCTEELMFLLSLFRQDVWRSTLAALPGSVLAVALECRNLDLAKRLLEVPLYADVEARDGQSPLVIAVALQQLDLVRAIVTAGVDLNVRSDVPKHLQKRNAQLQRLCRAVSPVSALDVACALFDTEMVGLLLQSGVDITLGFNPISIVLGVVDLKWKNAATRASTMIKLLLSKNASRLAHRPHQNTVFESVTRAAHVFGDEPISVACQKNMMEVVDMLMGDDPSVVRHALVPRRAYPYPTLMHLLAANGDVDRLKLVLEIGRDATLEEEHGVHVAPSKKGRKENTVADYAALAGHPVALALLLARGERASCKRVRERSIERARPDDCVLVNSILSVYHLSLRVELPIVHAAMVYGNLDVLKHLLAAGCPMSPTDVKNTGKNTTPLMHAIVLKKTDIALAVLRHDARAVKTCTLAQPILARQYRLVDALLTAGAPADAPATLQFKYKHLIFQQMSPLFAACFGCSEPTITELLRRGASACVADTDLGDAHAEVDANVEIPTRLPPVFGLLYALSGATSAQEAKFVRVFEMLISRGALKHLSEDLLCLALLALTRKRLAPMCTLLVMAGFDETGAVIRPVHAELFNAVFGKVYLQSYHPLHYAIRHFSEETVRLFLRCADASDINDFKDVLGFNALHIAALCGRAAIVSALLDQGADAFGTGGKLERGPLSLACYSGSLDVCTLLLQLIHPESELDAKGNTPLLIACERGHMDVVELLVQNDGDISRTNELGYNAPITAAMNGHDDIALVLVRHWATRAMLVTHTTTILHACAQGGARKTLEFVLSTYDNLDVTQPDEWEATPLYAARACGHVEVRKLMMPHVPSGFSMEREVVPFGFRSAVLKLGDRLQSSHGRYAKLPSSFSRGIPLKKYSIMQWCAKTNHAVGIKALADLGFKDKCSALHTAAKNGSVDVVQVLLDLSMSQISDVDEHKCTALMHAAFGGHGSTVGLLLDHGAKVSDADELGQNALHKVAQSARWDAPVSRCVVALLSKCVPDDIVVVDEHGYTPIHYAIMFNQCEFVYRATAMLHPRPIPLNAAFTSQLSTIPLEVRTLLYDVFGIEDVAMEHGAWASKYLQRLQWPSMRVLGFAQLQRRQLVVPTVEHEKKVYKHLMASLFMFQSTSVSLKFAFDSMASLPTAQQCRILQRLGTPLLFERHLSEIDETVTDVCLKYVHSPKDVRMYVEGTVLHEAFSFDAMRDIVITASSRAGDVLPSLLNTKTEELCRRVDTAVASVGDRLRQMESPVLRNARVMVDWSSFDTLPTTLWEGVCDGLVGHRGVPALHMFLDRMEDYDLDAGLRKVAPAAGLGTAPASDVVITFVHSPARAAVAGVDDSHVIIPFYYRNATFTCDVETYVSGLQMRLVDLYLSSLVKSRYTVPVEVCTTLTVRRYTAVDEFLELALHELYDVGRMCPGFTLRPSFTFVEGVGDERPLKCIATVSGDNVNVQIAFSAEVRVLDRAEVASALRSNVLMCVLDRLELLINDFVEREMRPKLRSYVPNAELSINWGSMAPSSVEDLPRAVLMRARLIQHNSLEVMQPLVQGIAVGWDTKVIGPLVRHCVSKVEVRHVDSNVSWVSYDAEKKLMTYNCALLAGRMSLPSSPVGPVRASSSSSTGAFLRSLQIASMLLLGLLRAHPTKLPELRSAVDTDRAFGAWSVVHGVTRALPGERVSLRLDCRNILNESCKATHIKNVNVVLGRNIVPELEDDRPFKTAKHTTSLFFSFVAPTVAKFYPLKVLVRGEVVAHAPDFVRVVCGEASAAATTVEAKCNTTVARHPIKLNVHLRDDHGNVVPYHQNNIVIRVDNAHNVLRHSVKGLQGMCELTVVPGEDGSDMRFDVLLNGTPVKDGTAVTFAVWSVEQYTKYASNNTQKLKRSFRNKISRGVHRPDPSLRLPAGVSHFLPTAVFSLPMPEREAAVARKLASKLGRTGVTSLRPRWRYGKAKVAPPKKHDGKTRKHSAPVR
eukprot:PhM_4_TR13915/c0_g1_i1/m.37432